MRIVTMRFLLVLASGLALGTGVSAVAAEPAPSRLSPPQLDRVTAGAFEANAAALSEAVSSSLVLTEAGSNTLIVSEPDPIDDRPAPISGVAGAGAFALTGNSGEPKTVGVATDVGGDGFALVDRTIGGSASGDYTAFASRTTVRVEFVVDPVWGRRQ
jgi:hypothetical protein